MARLLPSNANGSEILAIFMSSLPQMPQEATIRSHLVHIFCYLLNTLSSGPLDIYLADALANLPESAKIWLTLYGLMRDQELVPATLTLDHMYSALDYRASKHLNKFNKKYSKSLLKKGDESFVSFRAVITALHFQKSHKLGLRYSFT